MEGNTNNQAAAGSAPAGGARPGGSRFGGNRGGGFGAGGSRFGNRMRPGGGGPRGRGDRRPERQKPEFDTKIVSLRRVTRVVAGGKRFNFSAAIIAGDRNGRVGVGLGKGIDTSLAIDKATRDAKKHMIEVKRTKEGSITHETSAKYCAAVVVLRPAPKRGLVAGSAVRNVLALAGVGDVNAKILSRSKNKLNIARATVLALGKVAKQ